MTRRFDLTDGQWALLEPLLPAGKRPGRPSQWTRRQLIDGIRWRVRVGAPWRDVPASFGNWKTVYNRHRRWSGDGTLTGILDELRRDADVAEGPDWTIGVDGAVTVNWIGVRPAVAGTLVRCARAVGAAMPCQELPLKCSAVA